MLSAHIVSFCQLDQRRISSKLNTQKYTRIPTTSKSFSWKAYPWNKSLGGHSSCSETVRMWVMNSVAFSADDWVAAFAQPGNCYENTCSVLFYQHMENKLDPGSPDYQESSTSYPQHRRSPGINGWLKVPLHSSKELCQLVLYIQPVGSHKTTNNKWVIGFQLSDKFKELIKAIENQKQCYQHSLD